MVSAPPWLTHHVFQAPVVSMGRIMARWERTWNFLPGQVKRGSPYGGTEERQLCRRPAITWRNFHIKSPAFPKNEMDSCCYRPAQTFLWTKVRQQRSFASKCRMDEWVEEMYIHEGGWRHTTVEKRGMCLEHCVFCKAQLLKATRSASWLCANAFHSEEVCTAGAAALQYLSGVLARCKRNRSLKKGSPDTR